MLTGKGKCNGIPFLDKHWRQLRNDESGRTNLPKVRGPQLGI